MIAARDRQARLDHSEATLDETRRWHDTQAQTNDARLGETHRWHDSQAQTNGARLAEAGRRNRAREASTIRGQDMNDARSRGSASYRGVRAPRGGGAAATAVGPNGHTIVLQGGRWVDSQTGQPVQ